MKCVMCKHGDTHPAKVTVILQRDDSTIIIKAVPGDVCENCGEYHLSEAVTKKTLAMAEEAVMSGAELAVLGYSNRHRPRHVSVAEGSIPARPAHGH